MDRLRAAVAKATGQVAHTRPMRSVGACLVPAAGTKDGQRGQGLAEYALILGLIAVVAIVSLLFLGASLSEMFMDPISEEFGEVLSRLGI